MSLAISRKAGQRIHVALPDGRSMWITMAEVRQSYAMLAIDAPRDIIIKREELLEAVTGASVAPAVPP